MPNTVILRGEAFVVREDKGNAILSPGHLLEFNSSTGRVQKHATSGGAAARLFALETDFQGGGVSTAYASGDRVVYADCPQGTIVWAFLASGQNVSRGAFLMSAGDGTLTAQTSTNYYVAQADEAANATVAGTTTAGIRFRARVI
jgi:hypothetical protein